MGIFYHRPVEKSIFKGIIYKTGWVSLGAPESIVGAETWHKHGSGCKQACYAQWWRTLIVRHLIVKNYRIIAMTFA
jgi:hypothetical protein